MHEPSGDATFNPEFRRELERLFVWRRDVRHFRSDPVDEALIAHCLDLAQLSPSVGNSQPWRWINVESLGARAAVQTNFERCNADALAIQQPDRAALYARLKLSGLKEAPVQLAAYCDTETLQGQGLGRATMPQMLQYSVVSAITTFWLAARSLGLGVGWVSILDPVALSQSLGVPPRLELVAYLCVGWPLEVSAAPELERLGWQDRTMQGRNVTRV